ncbi:MAG: DUF3192 domain-containing protein [Syntrophaceae bacterium]
MKRIMFLFTILLLLSGCGLVTLTTTSIEASGNKTNIPKLEIGMNSTQVKELMGAPNKTEAFSLAESKKVLVWYFLTEGRAPFHRLDDPNYTPLVFENDILTGWGYVHLEKIRKQ